jgi:hypothetical protein
MAVVAYKPEKTGLRLHRSRKVVRGMMGPIGSGKSVTCTNELFRLGMMQHLHLLAGAKSGGVRRMRTAVIRNTYPELKTTTLNTFKDWAPAEFTSIRMDAPITARIRTEDIDWEFIFLAVDQEKDMKKLLSLELTNAWINEARELPLGIVRAVMGRIGRYPAKRDGGPVFPCILMDTNPPDTDHWWYRKFETEKPDGWELFKQPSAMLKNEMGVYVPNPEAENIDNLPGGFNYYLRQIPGNDDAWLSVYVRGVYGSVMDGKPVYSSYNDEAHCAKEKLEPMRGLPIYIGYDYGRTPTAIFTQITPNGQFRIIDELVVDTDGDGMGIREFTRDVVNPHIANTYADFRFVERGDPSGVAKDGSDLSCFDIQSEEGRIVSGAVTNDLAPRFDAVSRYMLRMVEGKPAFLLSPTCTVLRKGFLGGYKFVRMQISGEERYKDVPDKNKYSHPHDGLQYSALAILENQGQRIVKAREVVRVNRGGMQ